MDAIQKKLTALDIIIWLRENYKVGKSGSTSKNAVYQHYLDMCKEKGIHPSISATYFGKLVKRAFPDIKYNRKGPRGGTKQHYTHLKRIDPAKKSVERQLQQMPADLQEQYSYYHAFSLDKDREEMDQHMISMLMNREGAYVPSLSAMYASALEVEREEELTQHRSFGLPAQPPSFRYATSSAHEGELNVLSSFIPSVNGSLSARISEQPPASSTAPALFQPSPAYLSGLPSCGYVSTSGEASEQCVASSRGQPVWPNYRGGLPSLGSMCYPLQYLPGPSSTTTPTLHKDLYPMKFPQHHQQQYQSPHRQSPAGPGDIPLTQLPPLLHLQLPSLPSASPYTQNTASSFLERAMERREGTVQGNDSKHS